MGSEGAVEGSNDEIGHPDMLLPAVAHLVARSRGTAADDMQFNDCMLQITWLIMKTGSRNRYFGEGGS